MNITENETIRYKVVLEGRVLGDHASKSLAEASILSLNELDRQKVVIVPSLQNGKQILNG